MTKSFKHLVERYMTGVGFDLEDADAVQREIDDTPGIVCSELRVNRKNLHVEILSRQFQITQKFEKSTIPFPLEGQGSSVNIHMAPKLESLKIHQLNVSLWLFSIVQKLKPSETCLRRLNC